MGPGGGGGKPHLSPSLTKSVLQKAVRRGRCVAAARAAAHLLAEHPHEALRRLPVVSLEDAVLHPSLPLLVWFMAAQAKGWRLPPEAVGAVVRVAAELAACTVKDSRVAGGDDEEHDEEEGERSWTQGRGDGDVQGGDVDGHGGAGRGEGRPTAKAAAAASGWREGEEDNENVTRGSTNGGSGKADDVSDVAGCCNLAVACRGLDPKPAALVCSLLIRAHFGGMKGDVDMLRAGALTWRRRFISDARRLQLDTLATPLSSSPDSWLTHIEGLFTDAVSAAGDESPRLARAAPADVGALTRRDVVLAAVDFHVSPVVEELMQQPRVREAMDAAVRLAPELVAEHGHDLSGVLRSAIWRHSSSVTNKMPLAPPCWVPGPFVKCQMSTGAGVEARLGGIGEESRKDRAMATLWEGVEDAVVSFQRRFIARRFF